MIKVLVTGASGFFGRALCNTLRQGDFEVVEISHKDGDISKASTLAYIGPAHHVFHLAGKTFVPDSWEAPLDFIDTNVVGTTNVTDYCRRHGARLTILSGYLYGRPDHLPISEQAVARPNNPYALSKLLSERICEFHASHYSLDVSLLRPFNIFGPGQKDHFLIPHILKQVLAGKAVRIKDLAPRRDYLFIDDLVNALVKTMYGPRGYNVFNIGSGNSLSVKEIISVIQEIAGTQLPVIDEAKKRNNEIYDVYADCTKALKYLKWRPTTTFKEGIERLIKSSRRQLLNSEEK
jgi:nucleoside-diphosphate-sugar epimerase